MDLEEFWTVENEERLLREVVDFRSSEGAYYPRPYKRWCDGAWKLIRKRLATRYRIAALPGWKFLKNKVRLIQAQAGDVYTQEINREGLSFKAFTAKTRIGPPPPFDDDRELPGEPTSPRGTTASSFSANASHTAIEEDCAEFLGQYESKLDRDEFIALLQSGNIGILIPLAINRSEADFIDLLKAFAAVCSGRT